MFHLQIGCVTNGLLIEYENVFFAIQWAYYGCIQSYLLRSATPIKRRDVARIGLWCCAASTRQTPSGPGSRPAELMSWGGLRGGCVHEGCTGGTGDHRGPNEELNLRPHQSPLPETAVVEG